MIVTVYTGNHAMILKDEGLLKPFCVDSLQLCLPIVFSVHSVQFLDNLLLLSLRAFVTTPITNWFLPTSICNHLVLFRNICLCVCVVFPVGECVRVSIGLDCVLFQVGFFLRAVPVHWLRRGHHPYLGLGCKVPGSHLMHFELGEDRLVDHTIGDGDAVEGGGGTGEKRRGEQ